MQVQSLGWEDPLEQVMATHASILAWRIPRTEEPGGLQSMGSQRVMRLGMRALEYDPLSMRVKGVPASPCAEAQPG